MKNKLFKIIGKTAVNVKMARAMCNYIIKTTLSRRTGARSETGQSRFCL